MASITSNRQIGDVAASVQRTLDQFAEGLSGALSKVAQVAQQIAGFALAYEQIMECPPEYVRQLPAYLAGRAWYVPMADLGLSSIFRLAEMAREQEHDRVETALQGYVRSRLDELEGLVEVEWPRRSPIVSEALEAHRRGSYAVSIPTMLTQVDGICFDILAKPFFSTKNGVPETKSAVDDLINSLNLRLTSMMPRGSIGDLFFEQLRITSSASSRFHVPDGDSKQENSGKLNRHGVLHGIDVDYPTEANSLRTISMLLYLTALKSYLDEHTKPDHG